MCQRLLDALADPYRMRLFVNNLRCSTLHDDICRLLCLRELHCYGNDRVTELPRGLEKLVHLEVLDASNCSITHLREELSLLLNLRIVKLQHNRLRKFLWDCSALVTSLEILDLSHNCVEYFSPSFCILEKELCRKESAALLVLLHAPKALTLFPNEALLQPRDKRGRSDLSVMLPMFVDMCVMCSSQIVVGSPEVYVHFTRVAKEDLSSRWVPHFYPLCRSTLCHVSLHTKLDRM